VNRHLNVFVPYSLPPNHEDQLTRAAMIVLRAVPLLPQLWDWLLDHRLASESDLAGRDKFERALAGPIHLRAGMRVQRSWSWDEARRLDDAGLLAAAIREALAEILVRLEEPPLAPLPG
jgi:hypothetical protein